MQKQTKKKSAAALAILALVTLLSGLLGACVPAYEAGDPSYAPVTSDVSVETSGPQEESTPAGLTAMPKIEDIVNITPDTVVISGTCENGAVVTISGSKGDVTVNSRNGYFIAQFTLTNKTTSLLEATAKVEGKETSEVRAFSADYDATAEKRKDGYSVSVGKDSLLYFDSFLTNYIGDNLLSMTQIRDFKTATNKKIDNIMNRASGQPVEVIYVLVPDATTVDPYVFPEDTEKKSFTTRYDQISKALSETSATLIDMKKVLTDASKDSEYSIYRTNDSHLTEYGSYLVYKEIANKIGQRFPKAAARPIEDFDLKEVTISGGDYMESLGISGKPYTEKAIHMVPKFSLDVGFEEGDTLTTINISDIKKYKSEQDFNIYNEKTTKTVGINDRFIIRTGREELPSALIYRDSSAAPMMDILAERFNNMLVTKSDDFTINLTEATRYYSQNRKMVDYFIVIVSESNIMTMVDAN